MCSSDLEREKARRRAGGGAGPGGGVAAVPRRLLPGSVDGKRGVAGQSAAGLWAAGAPALGQKAERAGIDRQILCILRGGAPQIWALEKTLKKSGKRC